LPEYSDNAIVEAIQTGSSRETDCLKHLYQRELPKMLAYIRKNQGSEEEGRDLFQDVIVTLVEQIRKGQFRGDSSLGTYLYSIGRRMWINRLKQKGRAMKHAQSQTDAEIESSPSPLDVMLDQERDDLFQKMMGALGEKCRELLQLRLYLQWSMAKIAAKMGYKNEQNARNKHFKCKDELRKIILKNPLFRELIHRIPPSQNDPS